MHLSSLKNQLIEAYSQENLHTITTKLIEFNKNNNKAALKTIASLINDFTPFNSDNQSKIFNRLIMLYHPDKLKAYQQNIIAATTTQTLQEMMHIVQLSENIDQIGESFNNTMLSPKDFEDEYGWNYQSSDSDYYTVREDDESMQHLFDEENMDDFVFDPNAPSQNENSFLGAVKHKIYGTMAINFPVHLLEDMEEIEMAEYDIEELDGLEYCTYLKILDLSHNQIYDIKRLEHCEYIQELYLTDNQIYSIDHLSGLHDLRVLDLSNNRIENISTLYKLPSLEFVNLINNKVPQIQIDYLTDKGVVVVS